VPHVTTNDGVKLVYQEAGQGTPIVMIPGWSQSAALFKHQMEGLSDRYRVIAVDMRGHGESDKPNYGYRMGRLAKDLHDFLTTLDLRDVVIMAHSMGCSVTWGYLDLFGSDRISKLILIDEPAWVMNTPDMSEEEKANLGAIIDAEGAIGLYMGLRSDQARAVIEGFVGGMLTKDIAPDLKAWIIEENLKFPSVEAAELVLHHICIDWRDVIQRITLPTLVVGGKASHVPWRSQIWIHEQIAGSQLEIFEEKDGGSHFMFLEGPKKFNKLVADFIG
jgi:non-heme chloroperoxidase